MDELDKLDFIALEPGLGLKEPQILSQTAIENIKPQLPIKKPTLKSYKLPINRIYQFIKIVRRTLAWMVDHVFIGGIYLLLLTLSITQLPSSHLQQWKGLFESKPIILGHVILFFVIYGFYFLFFKQFKTPTLGQWVVFGDIED